jgi:hypothetical protein
MLGSAPPELHEMLTVGAFDEHVAHASGSAPGVVYCRRTSVLTVQEFIFGVTGAPGDERDDAGRQT